jgi:mannosyltransferase
LELGGKIAIRIKPGMTQLDLRRFAPYLLLSVLVAVAGYLRFFLIDAKTIWLDEAFSIWVAHHPLTDLWSWLIRIDQHPPLYYSLLHFWQALFGDLQGTVRAFSATCSVLTLPLFYLATQRFTDTATGLIATLILAVSPLHVRYAQETRMYALLTLVVAVALFCLAHILTNQERQRLRRYWLGLSISQAAIMLTHNSAAVFFPLALNLAIGGALGWKYWRGGVSSWPALNDPGFERRWLRGQALAGLIWLPWSIPFLIQAVGVDRQFWIPAPTLASIWDFFHNSNLAFLPGWFPFHPLWNLVYWLLLILGLVALRGSPARIAFFLALWLVPLLGELLVSLRRPIFSERTLLWTTLPYYLLIAVGVRRLGAAHKERLIWLRRPLQAAILGLLVTLSATSMVGYYFFFEKEDWARAAGYVAENIQPDDLIVFNATWVQLPFEYYFRHYETQTELRGLPVDLFDRGELEPQMTEADLPRLRALVEGRRRLWLVYSHDWYTDPDGIIPRELGRLMRRVEERVFVGLKVVRYEAR